MSGLSLKAMFKCELCNIEMTGSENYQQHIEGKKHLKKIKNVGHGLATIPQDLQAERENDKLNPSRTVAIPPSINPPVPKLPPQLPPRPKQPTAGDILGTNNEDPVMNAIKANMLGKLPLKRLAYDGRCDACGVDYSSITHEYQHLSGKKHLKKMKTMEGDSANSALLYCSYCNLKVNSPEQMDQHITGASHKKKVVKRSSASVDQVDHSVSKKKFVPSSGSEVSDSQLLPHNQPPVSLLQPVIQTNRDISNNCFNTK